MKFPQTYYLTLRVTSEHKAHAFAIYFADVSVGLDVVCRDFGKRINLSKSQSAIWMKEFKEAIEAENRTISGQSQSPILGTLQAQNNSFSDSKSGTKKTDEETHDTQSDSSNVVNSDVVGARSDTLSCACTRASCKRSPLKGRSSTGTRDSLGQRLGSKLKEIRKFQEKMRDGLAEGIRIERDGAVISISGKGLIKLDRKIASSKEALQVWGWLFERRDMIEAVASVALPLQFAKEGYLLNLKQTTITEKGIEIAVSMDGFEGTKTFPAITAERYLVAVSELNESVA